MTTRFGALALAAIVATTILVGCGSGRGHSGADKAGGSRAPVVLTLGSRDSGDDPATPIAEYFAAKVNELSGGKLRIHVILDAAGDDVPDTETRIVRMVRDGRLDLGWIGARAWDDLGVTSFQALQAPFLIDNYALLDRVTTGPLADEMLSGLKRDDVLGLALVPELLRHPVGLQRPFLSPSDFAGAHIADFPSRASDSLLRALGATPVHLGNNAIGAAIAARQVDGEESSFERAWVGSVITANVTFFGKALTLFAGERAFGKLSAAQQDVLRAAARRTLLHAATHPVGDALAFEGVLARQYCHTPGHIALASDAEIAALVRAARPVYAALDRDPQTKAHISEIRRLKATLPPAPRIVVPTSCLADRGTAVETGRLRSPSIVNGTYRWLLTAAGARAFGPPADDPGNTYPIVNTVVLRDGIWTTPRDHPPGGGTYRIVGDRIVFYWPQFGYDTTFTLSRTHDGSLVLTGVQPIDPGDEWIWSGAPWRRLGPPMG
jgi:TRAP-type C4-dicarboxylate transport system substrate-binding protein